MLLATGGAGRIFAASTNAFINTGDGLGMAARAGIPLEDMEFWQFHPTGVAGAGVLLTEGCRGEGAILRNNDGERFMERYAPTLKDLAPRDFVSRCMARKSRKGAAAVTNKDHIVLDMTHLGAETIMKRLPSVFEIGHNFANVDITARADSGGADDPLPDGRHPDQHPRPGRRPEGRRPERGDRRSRGPGQAGRHGQTGVPPRPHRDRPGHRRRRRDGHPRRRHRGPGRGGRHHRRHRQVQPAPAAGRRGLGRSRHGVLRPELRALRRQGRRHRRRRRQRLRLGPQPQRDRALDHPGAPPRRLPGARADRAAGPGARRRDHHQGPGDPAVRRARPRVGRDRGRRGDRDPPGAGPGCGARVHRRPRAAAAVGPRGLQAAHRGRLDDADQPAAGLRGRRHHRVRRQGPSHRRRFRRGGHRHQQRDRGARPERQGLPRRIRARVRRPP